MRRMALILFLAVGACAGPEIPKGWYRSDHPPELHADNYACVKESLAYGGIAMEGNVAVRSPSIAMYMGCMTAKGYEPRY
jgi:hypothetical protein